ncbi:protein crumbs homolog 3a [Antennarius striatus]|uniref:protein crumbs homolog 3a n=1 Tax=Antennarius striatus TaxID=241820 RepID=UPI0035AE317B
MKWTRADDPKPQSALTWPSWSQVESAVRPDAFTMPGVVAMSVLLLALSSNPVRGNYTILGTDTRSSNNGTNVAAIVSPVVILGVLAIALGIFFFFKLKKKRQTEGTYRPSAEEQSGASGVVANDALKLPKEERLI